MSAQYTPETLSVHEERARELLAALNRINALEGELHEAKLPRNWDPVDMVIQLQLLLADGVEIVIGSGRLLILDGEAHYQVQSVVELKQTLDSIHYLKRRRVA
jgi:hypothetical protein